MAHHRRRKAPGARGHGRCCEGTKGYKKGKIGEAMTLRPSDRRRMQKEGDVD